MSLAPTSGDGGASSDIDIFSSCKGIDKGLNFFRIGHMQQIEMVDREGFLCVRCTLCATIKAEMDTMYSINQLGAKWHGEGGTLYVHVQMGWLGAVTMLLHYTAFQNFVKFVRRYLQCQEYPNGTDQDSRR